MERQIIVVDTETTEADAETAHVVEIAAVLVDFSGADKHKTVLDRMVRPGRRISYAAMGTHHITEAMAARGENFEEVKEWLQAVVKAHDALLAAHRAAFDQQVMRWTGDGEPEWIDTLRLSRHAWPDAENHKAQTLRYMLDISPGEGTQAHRALGDAMVTAGILARAVEALQIRDSEALRKKAKAPVVLKTCGFGKHRGTTWEKIPADYLEWMLGQDFGEDEMHTAREMLREKAEGT